MVAGLVGAGVLAMLIFGLVGYNYLNYNKASASNQSTNTKENGPTGAENLLFTALLVFLIVMGLLSTCCCLSCCWGTCRACCDNDGGAGTNMNPPRKGFCPCLDSCCCCPTDQAQTQTLPQGPTLLIS